MHILTGTFSVTETPHGQGLFSWSVDKGQRSKHFLHCCTIDSSLTFYVASLGALSIDLNFKQETVLVYDVKHWSFCVCDSIYFTSIQERCVTI